MRSTTMKYHNLFFALQAFTFALGGLSFVRKEN